MSFPCHTCGKTYSTKGKLNQHKLQYHKIDERTANLKCNEVDCNFKSGNLDCLIKHLEEGHNKEFEVCNLTFNSLDGMYLSCNQQVFEL